MDYYKILYLTEMIRNDVSGKEKQLKSIYDNAVKDSDSYKSLSKILDGYSFFDNGTGRLIADEIHSVRNAVFQEPANGVTLLRQMNSIVKNVQSEIQASRATIEAPGITSMRVGILENGLVNAISEVYDILASAVVFMFLVLGRQDLVQNIRWHKNNTINDKIEILESDYLTPLSHMDLPLECWRIKRVKLTGTLFFSDHRYVLESISYNTYLRETEHMDCLNDNLYAEPGMENNNHSGIVYIGMGNVVSCSADRCIDNLMGKKLFIDRNIGILTESEVNLISEECLLRLLRVLSKGENYSVSPETAVSLMNELTNGKVVSSRKRHGECLFCGKRIGQGTVCQNHFTFERV